MPARGHTLRKEMAPLDDLLLSVIGPFLANGLGWVTAEVGRQPWIV